jgi:hypothetical protein
MKKMKKTNGGWLAVLILLGGVAWLVLRIFGVLNSQLIHIPTWLAGCCMVIFLAAPIVLTQLVSQAGRLVTAASFLAAAYVVPYAYGRLPALTWLTLGIGYIEVFLLLPRLKQKLWTNRQSMKSS